MKVILDTMGSDNGAVEFVKAAYLAADKLDGEFILVGKEDVLLPLIKENDPEGKLSARISVMNASEVVEMHDDPLSVMKEKPDSSMKVALKLLADGDGDILVSAGNTGALLTQATLIVKRIRGIRRAALTPVTPTATGNAVLCDSGANVECTPEYLYQFALMGSFYAEKVMGIPSPKVGLLNNGTEDHKGTELHRATYKVLTDAHNRGEINFVGNIEGRDGPLGKVDVIVADGFSGNIYLKTMEGIGLYFARELKNVFYSSLIGKISGLLLKKSISGFRNKVDYNKAGGAPLLGVKKPIVKAHGSAKAEAICNCVLQAKLCYDAKVCDLIAESLKKEESDNE